MAPVNDNRARTRASVNGPATAHIAPSSSIIATHLATANGNSLPQFDEKRFAQLIDECLESDGKGNSNWGTDVRVNKNLICVIVKAGIDPAPFDKRDPFVSEGRNPDQISRYLEVINLAIQRSPSVLYTLSGPEDLGSADENVPLFVWLIPKLFSLVGGANDENRSISSKAWDVLSNIVASTKRCSINHSECQTISSFIARNATGMVLLWMAGSALFTNSAQS